MQIEFGGIILEIGSDKRAKVEAKSDFLLAAERGDAFIWTRETAVFTALDTILCVRNDNPNKALHIEKVILESSHAITEIEMHRITAAYTSAGTVVVGTNLLPGGGAAEASGVADETGNTQGTVIERRVIHASIPVEINFKGSVKLNNAQAFGIDSTLGDDWIYASIWGYFK